MKLSGIGLAIGLMLATLLPAAGAFAAPAVSKEARDKGMEAAPALVTAAGAECQVADARLIGESTDPKTKVKSTLFEVACTGAEGLVIDKVGAGEILTFTCLEAAAPGPDGKPSQTQCLLPGNADPKAALALYVAKSGTPCTITKARALGHSSTVTLFELVCSDSPGGYILQTSAPPRLDKPISMNPCIGYDQAGAVKCELTERSAQGAVVDQLLAKSGKACTVKDRSFIGVSQKGLMFYEVACQDGKGYVLEQKPDGSFSRAIDCASADSIGGGCKLTDARKAKTEQAGLYTTLAKKAGYQCDVSGYAPLPNSADNQGKEVVELECSNRPDGAVAFFGATSADKSVVYDCAHAELKGYRCGLTKTAAAYPRLTDDLRALGKSSCQVSGARVVGVSADHKGYVEVACADGLQGYMIQFELNPLVPKTTIVCTEAKGISGGCTLPGNVKKS